MSVKCLVRLQDIQALSQSVTVTSVKSVPVSTGKPQSLEPDKSTEITESNTNPLITDKQVEAEEIKYKLFPGQFTWNYTPRLTEEWTN